MSYILTVHSPLLSRLLLRFRLWTLSRLIANTSDMAARAYMSAAHRELSRRLQSPADREVSRRRNVLLGALTRPIFNGV